MTNQEKAINGLIKALNKALGRIDKLVTDDDAIERAEADRAIGFAVAAIQDGPKDASRFVQIISAFETEVWALTEDGRIFSYRNAGYDPKYVAPEWLEIRTQNRISDV